MHSPKKKKKTSLAIHTKLSIWTQSVLSGEEEDQRRQDQTAFLHNVED
ncbi:unnamed protein product [Staurois parvus]|uniref:Uncharacterized protein n=1 Tax=Staurois parvus TaxID=386267 RepID=A0ABN9EME5_9NEOB|nr:unnamed protein product [Staurois parvus]